jgi:hypothetical protein
MRLPGLPILFSTSSRPASLIGPRLPHVCCCNLILRSTTGTPASEKSSKRVVIAGRPRIGTAGPLSSCAQNPTGTIPSSSTRSRGESNDSKSEAPLPVLRAARPPFVEEHWHVDNPVVIDGGVLTTAGNIVLQGTPDGKFAAYAADSGKLLWSYNTKSVILGTPSTGMVGGKQVIFVPAGDGGASVGGKVLTHLALTQTTLAPSRLLAFGIGGSASIPNTAPKARLFGPSHIRGDLA